MIDAADITPGYYWVTDRKRGNELSVVRVEPKPTFETIDSTELAVWHCGWEFDETVRHCVERFDFIVRIEPPDLAS
jgi:hypothetical protein